MTPDYNINAGSSDITANIRAAGLVELRHQDNRGVESDEVTIEINDIDGKVYWPSKGAKLEVAIGYEETGLVPKGVYIVDRISHYGPPDRIIINAKAADMLKRLKVQRHRDWHQTTLGGIVSTIASEHGLRPAITQKLASIYIEHIDQTDSDLNFITRLAEDYNATAKPAGGALVFIEKGARITSKGRPMPVVTIKRNEVDTHAFNEEGRTEYTGVRAPWHDLKRGKLRYAKVGGSEKFKTLRKTYSTEAEASKAAQAEFDRLSQVGYRMRLSLKHGRPDLLAEMKVMLEEWRPELCAVQWVIDSVVHTIHGQNGLSSEVMMVKQ